MTDESPLFGLLRGLSKTDRGRRHSLHPTPSRLAITAAAKMVDSTDIDWLVEAWLHEDHPNRSNGLGRPEVIGVRPILVGVLALAVAGLPVSLTSLHHALTSDDLHRDSRRMMGMPTSTGYVEDQRLNRNRRRIAYPTVARTFAKITATFEPKPFPTHRGSTPEEVEQIAAAFDPDVVARNQKRAYMLKDLLLFETLSMLPKDIRSRWSGDVSVDGTVLPIHGSFGHRSKRRKAGTKTLSPEVNGGIHARTPDKRDLSNSPETRTSNKAEYIFGYDATLALMTNPVDGEDLPRLVIGMSIDKPSMAPGLNAAMAVQGIGAAGFPVGTMTVDLGFSQQLPENFALPIRALGYELMHMFKKTELGIIQASYKGLIVVEGRIYGPCLPERLRLATRRFEDGEITEDEFRDLIQQRVAYEARPKSHKSGSTTYVYRCPGAGTGRTVSCDYKPVSAEQEASERGRKLLPLLIDGMRPDQSAAPICANTTSVTVPIEKFARFLLKHPYKSPEWTENYKYARNEMEGKNGYLKDPLGVRLALAGERRFRGYAKQLLAATAKLVAANIDTVKAWLDKQDKKAPPPIVRRGRRPKPALRAGWIQPDGPPLRSVGHALPDPGDVA